MAPVVLFGSQLDQIPLGITPTTGLRDDMMLLAVLTFREWVLLPVVNDCNVLFKIVHTVSLGLLRLLRRQVLSLITKSTCGFESDKNAYNSVLL